MTNKRTATAPLSGGARDTLPGAVTGFVAVWVLNSTGSPELATAAAAASQGILTFLRKKLMDWFDSFPTT